MELKGEATVIVYQEVDSSENWDSIRVENSYNPKSCLENCVIRQAPSGSKPSERKAFRAAAFKRFASQNFEN